MYNNYIVVGKYPNLIMTKFMKVCMLQVFKKITIFFNVFCVQARQQQAELAQQEWLQMQQAAQQAQLAAASASASNQAGSSQDEEDDDDI